MFHTFLIFLTSNSRTDQIGSVNPIIELSHFLLNMPLYPREKEEAVIDKQRNVVFMCEILLLLLLLLLSLLLSLLFLHSFEAEIKINF